MKSVFHSTSSFLFFASLCILNACNHLFYYPDSHFYSDPSQANVFYENLVWENPENLKLQVLSMLPKGKEKGSILHLHGNAQNRSSHFHFSYWLTDYGYHVFVPDYRGYGGSQGVPSRKGLLNDAKFLIEQTCKIGKKPVFVFAQSLGAAVVIPALAQLKNSCVCGLIVESSFSSYRRIARQKLDSLWFAWPFQYPLSFLVSDDLSPIDFVGELKIPILFIHGTKDSIVPYEFGKELFEKSTSSDKEFWSLPDAGHTPAFFNIESPYKKKLVEWLNQHELKCTNPR